MDFLYDHSIIASFLLLSDRGEFPIDFPKVYHGAYQELKSKLCRRDDMIHQLVLNLHQN